MKFNFLPREDTFFEKFKEQALLSYHASAYLVKLMGDFENLSKHINSIHELERQGDKIVHDTAKKLAQSFVTPIDREDIHALCTNLDDIMDFIESSAQKMELYGVSAPTEPAKQLANSIIDATKILVDSVSKLMQLEDISDNRRNVKIVEKQADAIHRAAVGELFKNEKDAIELIKWKEIYQSLETVTDKCEDVMDVLEGIIIKYS